MGPGSPFSLGSLGVKPTCFFHLLGLTGFVFTSSIFTPNPLPRRQELLSLEAVTPVGTSEYWRL